MVGLDRLSQVEAIINYQFTKPERAYLQEALRITSSEKSPIGGRCVQEGNKKLAIIGDVVMAVVVAEYWFSDKNSIIRGWGEMHCARLSNKSFKQVVLGTKLASCCTEQGVSLLTGKTAATLLEALIGAIYLDSDCDLNAVRKAMVALGFIEVMTSSTTSSKISKTTSKTTKKAKTKGKKN